MWFQVFNGGAVAVPINPAGPYAVMVDPLLAINKIPFTVCTPISRTPGYVFVAV
jgi:hypothetical protein